MFIQPGINISSVLDIGVYYPFSCGLFSISTEITIISTCFIFFKRGERKSNEACSLFEIYDRPKIKVFFVRCSIIKFV